MTRTDKMETLFYTTNSSGPFKVFIESLSGNIKTLHSVSLGKILFLNKVQYILKIEKLGRNRI